MQAKVAISILAVLTVTLFTMAAVHNNDLFWGDRTLLSALRVDDPAWQRFFARFDTRSTVSLAFVLPVSAVLWWLKKKLEAAAYLLILPTLLFTVSFCLPGQDLPDFFHVLGWINRHLVNVGFESLDCFTSLQKA